MLQDQVCLLFCRESSGLGLQRIFDLTLPSFLSSCPLCQPTRAGYYSLIFHRPDLYDILLSQIPAGKISFNKKIVSYEQDKDGVTIHTSDNETFHGDILVGADGTYSTIRKIMQERLSKTNQLPLSDRKGLRATHACVIGTTKPLDPEKYPLLKDNAAYFSNVVGHAKAHTVRSPSSSSRVAFGLFFAMTF